MTSLSAVTSPFDPAGQPKVTMRSPGEIVSAIPFLLGFAPTDSVVVISLRKKRIGLTCRVDLDDVIVEQCGATIVEALAHDGATAAIIVGYGDSRFTTSPALTRVRELLLGAGLGVAEQISVVGDRWFHERCTEARCCPPEGTLVADHESAPSTMALGMGSGGYRADRDEVVAECRPDRPLFLAAIRSELEQPADGTELDDDTIVADLCAVLGWIGAEPPTAAQVARAALGCGYAPLRDVWYSLIAPGVMGEQLPELTDLHQRLCAAGRAAGDLGSDGILLGPQARSRVLARVLATVRNLPDDQPDVTVWLLTVAAAAYLCAGDGARARVLAERAWALDVEPPGMLQTLAACLEHGFRPPAFGRLSADADGSSRD